MIVADECDEVTERGGWRDLWRLKIVGLKGKGFDPDKTFDFQADAKGWYNPAKDFQTGRWAAGYYRWKIDTVVNDNSKDNAVLKAAMGNTPAGSKFILGGSKRYNCCDWVGETLQIARVAGWENINPKPFGPKNPPGWVVHEIVGKAVDKYYGN